MLSSGRTVTTRDSLEGMNLPGMCLLAGREWSWLAKRVTLQWLRQLCYPFLTRQHTCINISNELCILAIGQAQLSPFQKPWPYQLSTNMVAYHTSPKTSCQKYRFSSFTTKTLHQQMWHRLWAYVCMYIPSINKSPGDFMQPFCIDQQLRATGYISPL